MFRTVLDLSATNLEDALIKPVDFKNKPCTFKARRFLSLSLSICSTSHLWAGSVVVLSYEAAVLPICNNRI